MRREPHLSDYDLNFSPSKYFISGDDDVQLKSNSVT
jgi:hypothetical protein